MKRLNVKRFDEMNVIPIIDVMLVLLAIVLTTSTFVSQGLIPVELPESSEVEASQQETPWVVAVNKEKEIYFNEVKVTTESLEKDISEAKKDQNFVLRMDASVNFQEFIMIMDIFRRHQLENIAIQASEVVKSKAL